MELFARVLLTLLPLLLLAPSPFSPLRAESPAQFREASPEYALRFPRDYGSHPDFQTEWWYFTGHLFSPGKRAFRDSADFGFQLTFFRRRESAESRSPWDGGFLAHAALSDLGAGRFYADKRFVSGNLGLAGAAETGLNVWNREWKAQLDSGSLRLEYRLLPQVTHGRGAAQVSLHAEHIPAPVAQGENGFSRKGACDSCASHYYSIPRIELRGEIKIGDAVTPVHGLAWMDHEFMSNALQADQAGWDWFSLMLEDGRNVMLFKLRARDGGLSYASGSVQHAGEVRALESGDFSIEETDFWTSSSGTRYPSRWRVKIPSAGIDEVLTPLLADQEVRGDDAAGLTYWEGAVRSASGRALGYVEMTGYDKALGARF